MDIDLALFFLFNNLFINLYFKTKNLEQKQNWKLIISQI